MTMKFDGLILMLRDDGCLDAHTAAASVISFRLLMMMTLPATYI